MSRHSLLWCWAKTQTTPASANRELSAWPNPGKNHTLPRPVPFSYPVKPLNPSWEAFPALPRITSMFKGHKYFHASWHLLVLNLIWILDEGSSESIQWLQQYNLPVLVIWLSSSVLFRREVQSQIGVPRSHIEASLRDLQIKYSTKNIGESEEAMLLLTDVENIHLPDSELALAPTVFLEYVHTALLAEVAEKSRKLLFSCLHLIGLLQCI